MKTVLVLGLLAGPAFTATLVNAADPEGPLVFKAHCSGCHTLDADRWGPALRGVVGRPAGSRLNYDYSAGLRSNPFIWDEEHLDAWLRNPSALVTGVRMNVRVANPEDRRAVIRYLREQGSESR
jgi:cytochrome c